ncbi:nucleolin-like [Odontomachus brunneus]|uniref:nucleolin-like n=1 Tax=Odontomachus brunneus TaxID=486640 RepID=UPI0013F2A9E5|nr:nucleolin-like [Odontomachus brunneus]
MKKTKDVSDEDEYSADDPDEVEGASEEEWTPEAGPESGAKIRPQRETAKKRQHSEEEEEEDEDEGESDDDIDEEDSDSDTGKKPKRKRRSKKEDDEKDSEEDDSDNSFNESSGEAPKDYTSGAFVVAKTDVDGVNDPPTLWRIDGKALLQKFLPFKEDGKTLYKSTSTYSGWSVNNKDNYLVAHVTFKVQSRAETIVELHLFQQQEVKDEKED